MKDALPQWREQRERGSPALMDALARVALRLGRPAAGAVLPAVSSYFVVFSRRARRASRDYLARALGRSATLRDTYRHINTFSTTILDRVLWLDGRLDDYEVAIEGVDALDEAERGGRGGFLVGAHFGSFELLRVLATTRPGLRVRAMMHPHNARKLAAVLERRATVRTDPIIELGRPQTMLEVRDTLADGGFVALLADRATDEGDMVAVPFLGAPARFPRGPFKLAALLGAPIVLFRGIWQGGRRYEVAFERFAPVTAVDEAVARYATWLERECRRSPYNWFNFYDFWAP